MSAPHELWLLGPDDTPPTWTVDDMCIDYGGTGVRYLRADLTCGECRLQNEQLALSCPCNRYGGNPAVNVRPACMAFVPREKR